MHAYPFKGLTPKFISMKRIVLASLAALLLFASCKKDKDDNKPVEVVMDGKKTTLRVSSAELYRQRAYNNKALSLTLVTSDEQYRITFGVVEQTADGNSMSVKSYRIGDIEEDYIEGFANVAIKNGSSYTGSGYDGTGTVVITSINEGSKTVSGTFAITLTDLTPANPLRPIVLTEGRFENVKYTVQN